MFCLLFVQIAYSAVFGIDFGSCFVKVGMVQPGRGVHVALNQNSKRLSPTYFAFWNQTNPRAKAPEGHWELEDIEECAWEYTDRAKSHSLRFPDNMIKGIAPILGKINGLTRYETFALLLRHLISTVDEGRWTPETAQLVLTVEPKLPRKDRIAISEAVRLSGATLNRIIDSSTAAAQVYALEKRTLYMEKPKTALFIDIGATFTWAALFKFENDVDTPVVQELSIVTNSSLGGDLMDLKIRDLLLDKFVQQNKCERPTDKRTLGRFLEEANRAKTLLTINNNADIKMEDILDDYSLTYKLTREEFNGLITEFNQSLRNIYLESLEQANFTSEDVDSIELIGGVTRVPFVQDVLMEISGLEKLNRTMNSDEAVALGAGYVGASQSSAFIVKQVKMAPFCNSEVFIEHNGKKTQIFTPKSRLNETAFYEFPVSENGNITIIDDGDELETINIQLPENTSEELNLTVWFAFDELTAPYMYHIQLNGTFLNKDERNVTYYQPSWSMTWDQFNFSRTFIQRMDEVMDERRRFQEIRNDYESYIYKIKDKLEYDPIFKRVVNETERENLTAIANEHQAWLFGDHEEPLNASILQQRLDDIKSNTSSAEKRAEELVKRAPAFNKLNVTLHNVFRALNETWPSTKPWLTEEQLDSVWSTYNRTKTWLEDKYQEQLNKTEFEDPVVTASEIDTQRYLLEWNYNSTSRLKKPTPTPIPKPTPNIIINGQPFNGSIINGTFVNGSWVNGTFENGTTFSNLNASDIEGTNETETNSTEPIEGENTSDEAGNPTDEEKSNDETKTEANPEATPEEPPAGEKSEPVDEKAEPSKGEGQPPEPPMSDL